MMFSLSFCAVLWISGSSLSLCSPVWRKWGEDFKSLVHGRKITLDICEMQTSTLFVLTLTLRYYEICLRDIASQNNFISWDMRLLYELDV